MKDNVASMLADKIGELRSSGKDIERQVAALKTAYDLLIGTKTPAKQASKPTNGKAINGHRKRKAYTLDKQALPKTLALVQDAKYAVTPRRVATRFKISNEAAGMRLRTLLKRGLIARVAAGKYKVVTGVEGVGGSP